MALVVSSLRRPGAGLYMHTLPGVPSHVRLGFTVCLFSPALDKHRGQPGALPLFPPCRNPSITKVGPVLAGWGLELMASC